MACKSRSLVWNYFEKSEDGKTVICQIGNCKAKLSYSGSTSGMNKHVNSRHPGTAQEISTKRSAPDSSIIEEEDHAKKMKPRQPTINEMHEKKIKFPEGHPRKKEIDNCIATMILKDLQPFSIVEDEGFKYLLKNLEPRYTLPSRSTVSRTLLPKMNGELRKKLKGELDAVDYIAITTDCWTSRATDSYITATAHFIDSEWNLRSVVLETVIMIEAHTSENLRKQLLNIFESWEIKEKIVAIVSDNASNIKKAIKELGLPHVGCFAHTLNLVVKKALSSTGRLQDIIKKCRKISTYFNHSSKASNKLIEFQAQNGFSKHKLKQEVETRWNSTYHMLERYLEQRKVVSMTLEWFDKGDMNLDADEVKETEMAVESLRLFEEVTSHISAEKQPTLSKIGPIVQDIIESLEQNHESEIRDHLRQEMTSRFEGIASNKELSTSTYLDPRLRDIYFRNKGVGFDIAQDEVLSIIKKNTESAPNKDMSGQKEENEVSTSQCKKDKKEFIKRLLSKSEEIKASQKKQNIR